MDKTETAYLARLRSQLEATEAEAQKAESALPGLRRAAAEARQAHEAFKAQLGRTNRGSHVLQADSIPQNQQHQEAVRTASAAVSAAESTLRRSQDFARQLRSVLDAPQELARAREEHRRCIDAHRQLTGKIATEGAALTAMRGEIERFRGDLEQQARAAKEAFSRGESLQAASSAISATGPALQIVLDTAKEAITEKEAAIERMHAERDEAAAEIAKARARVLAAEAAAAALALQARLEPIMPLVARALAAAQLVDPLASADAYPLQVDSQMVDAARGELQASV